MKKIILSALIVCFLMPMQTLLSATDNIVPRELSAWSDWVLRDAPELSCPILYNAGTHFCAFPATLKFRLSANGGSFTQHWLVHKKSWVSLPGGPDQWPQRVTDNQKPAIVINRNDHPAIELSPGTHAIEGKFTWTSLPNSIPVADESGLVYLTLDNNSVDQPDLRNGQLWLRDTNAIPTENNRLDIQVFRKITDSIPLRVTTSMAVEVSGQQREIQLTGSVLKDFRPAAINSRLPARLDAQGILHLQVRPGRWVLDIETLHMASLEHFQLQKNAKPWPEKEVWVFDHQPQIRMVKVTGRQSIDPTQTQLPDDWKNLPAYLMTPGETLDVDVVKRGNPDPEPDQLTLNRVLWLDFAGDGITVKDTITGTLSQHWRLNALPELKPGQVLLDGQPQFITQLPDQDQQGVEVRQGNVQLQADSRMVASTHDLSATGWDSAFNKVSAELNLPVGYRLIHVAGGHAEDAWFNRWTLMDFFMVLITAIAVYRLWGRLWGAVALITLALTWHEADAPQYIWLNLIVTIALLRALSPGRLQQWLMHYRNVTTLVLAILLLDFAVTHIRLSLYPQLEQPGIIQQGILEDDYQMDAASPAAMVSEEVMSSSVENYRSLKTEMEYPAKSKPENLMQVDPNALIQTGPGLPAWQWQHYRIDWDGPVNQAQRIQLFYMSPFVFRVFNIVCIALMVLLTWRLFDYNAIKLSIKSFKPAAPLTGLVLLLSMLGTGIPTPAQAEYPSAELLKELQTYLAKPKDCLPECAGIESMDVVINAGTLRLNLRLHAKEDVVVPLPVPIQKWTPSLVTVDGKSATGLFRRQDQYLWLRVEPGTHRVVIEGKVAHLNQLKIDYMLKPHAIEVQASGWSTDGMDQSISAINAITFTRVANQQAGQRGNKNISSDIPVFADVNRRIDLGLDWSVDTTVQLLSGTALPAILRIPLLPGESVISEGIKVENGFAVITLNDNRRRFNWRSTLAVTEQLKLQAADSSQFREIWQLNASPVWHVAYEGIPVIYHQREGQYWQPEWQPWPGETVMLKITRPQGVAGNTLTIDHSYLLLTPGENITDAELRMSLRSSLGGQHDIRLPADAELLSVSINDSSVPVRINAGVVALPLMPGSHQAVIKWREARGIGFGKFNSPDVDLGADSVNASIAITPGYQRWVLLAGGPLLGPAVLFWGVLFVILMAAAGLSRVKDIPLSLAHWILLGIGLSTTTPAATLLVAGWLFALRWRGQADMSRYATNFNVIQVGILIFTFFALSTLLFAVQQGLLGAPDMQIAGNQSSSHMLNWYSDRSAALLPHAWIVTVPVMTYRILMLLWSIWLAFALIKWLRWSWTCYSGGGYWKSKPAKIVVPENTEKNQNKETENANARQ